MIIPHIIIALAFGLIGVSVAAGLGAPPAALVLTYSVTGMVGLMLSVSAMTLARVSQALRKPSGRG